MFLLCALNTIWVSGTICFRNLYKPPGSSSDWSHSGAFKDNFSSSDPGRFGRKPVMFASGALQSLSTFAQAFATSWPLFCVLYFITGLGRFSFYLSTFVLGKFKLPQWIWSEFFSHVTDFRPPLCCFAGSEIFSRKVRVLFASLGVCVGFAMGYMSLPLFAYFLRDWKQLFFGISLPCLIYVPLWWLVFISSTSASLSTWVF